MSKWRTASQNEYSLIHLIFFYGLPRSNFNLWLQLISLDVIFASMCQVLLTGFELGFLSLSSTNSPLYNLPQHRDNFVLLYFPFLRSWLSLIKAVLEDTRICFKLTNQLYLLGCVENLFKNNISFASIFSMFVGIPADHYTYKHQCIKSPAPMFFTNFRIDWNMLTWLAQQPIRCFISALCDYATVRFIYDIDYRSNLACSLPWRLLEPDQWKLPTQERRYSHLQLEPESGQHI